MTACSGPLPADLPMRIRLFQPGDLESLYAISLATGDKGGDASALHSDGRLIGHIYSAPYARLEPELVFIAEDDAGIGGFVLGTIDTARFEEGLERSYWPELRTRYRAPSGDPALWDADARRAFQLHNPRLTPARIKVDYPAHLHLNLLPRLQGRGLGRRLLDHWTGIASDRGARAFHVTLNSGNKRSIRFWSANGFAELWSENAAVWYGRAIA